MTETDSAPITFFRSRTLPMASHLAGYAYIVNELNLSTVLPYQMHAIATTSARQRSPDWIVHPYQQMPRQTTYDNLVFALKYEGVNLLILKQVFVKEGSSFLASAIRRQPTSGYARRLCFFYEWLTEDTIDPPDGIGGAYVDALDAKFQFATASVDNVSRWRVRNNLPGTSGFCPLIDRTQKLDGFISQDLQSQAEAVVRDVPKELLRRAAAFLLLNDSKASFEIEREKPSKDRAQRWAALIGRAGEAALSTDMLIELQKTLIEDDRFVKLGLRGEGGFVGEHTPFGEPRPDHISARAEDLVSLLDGVVLFERLGSNKEYDAVLTAASVAFGFVYIHPFEDGNGRLHRYLINHVLSARQFFPEDVVPPTSVAILADLVAYRHTLESVSRPLLTVIDWKSTERGNVEVLSDSIDFYRYFDATPHAEFIFECLQRTIEKELKDELRFLSSRDDFHKGATEIIDMPERVLDLLFHMLRQNDAKFSQRMRQREFSLLTDDEVLAFEGLYAQVALDH